MKNLHLFSIIIISFFLASGAWARIIFVPDEYETIQLAIDIAETGDEIIVKDGTYNGDGFRDISFQGKAIRVCSENGKENCVIKGNADISEEYRAFILDQNETSESILEGFTIQDFYTRSSGPGILLFDSSLTLRNCDFINNYSIHEGGAISVYRALDTLSISDCTFYNNSANGSGGAISVWEGPVEFINNTFVGNTGSFDGGAIGLWKSSGTIANCYFDSNVNDARGSLLDSYGGAIAAWRSSVDIINCLFTNNIGRGVNEQPNAYHCLGAAVFLDSYEQSEPNQIINCTLYGNRIEIYGEGGGIYANPETIIRNCVLWGNDEHSIVAPAGDIQYCSSQEFHHGEGNTKTDPQLFNPERGLYYFLNTSPCIDTGHDESGNICFATTCLDTLFASVSGSPDSGTVDRGYHYQELCPIPTPTPTPTSPPICDTTQLTLDMPSDYYRPGDPCYCTVTVCNAEGSTLTSYPLFVVLDVYGALFWGPGFTEEIDSYVADYPQFPENETVVTVIPEFIWPNITASGAGINFITALTTPEMSAIFGEMDEFEFGWGN